MAMVYTSIFSPNSIYLQPSPNPNNFIPKIKSKPKILKLSKAVSINVDYLETEFSGHGATFSRLGESCVVRMGLDNGSVATLMLPSGLITSYKAPMWHGGLLELLHTSVSEGDDDGDAAMIRGGVSAAFKLEGNGGVLWSTGVWNLRNVSGSPDESIQVELISNPEEKLEIKHMITLQQDALSSEIEITNLRSTSIQITGSIIGHLAISTPEAAYAVGLESSNFFIRPPIFSSFSIIPPDFSKNDSGSRNYWRQLLSGWGETVKTGQTDEQTEGEETDNYKHLTEKMSMIYTSAPRSFTIMDRGKRNSIVVGREGFEELYILSPGSTHKPYGKYAYLCVGQAALLKPVTIGAGSKWKGVQHLHNPNM